MGEEGRDKVYIAHLTPGQSSSPVMYRLGLLVACAVLVGAQPQYYNRPPPAVSVAHGGPVIPIISQTQDGPNPDGSYQWSYETGNGIQAREQGVQKALPDGASTAAQGSFHFVAPDGQDVSITYTADENGYVAVGNAIPTPPPIPPEILRSLEYNAAHPEQPGPPAPFRG